MDVPYIYLQRVMTVENNLNNYENSIDIIKEYPQDKRYTLAMLQDIQRHYGFIPREAMEYISEYLNLPLSHIYSMATFYKALKLTPKGKHTIKVCSGTACHIRGSETVKDQILSILNIKPGETTSDGLFSLEVVNCIGACALAPVMVIDDKYYGNMTPEKIQSVIDQYKGASIYG